LNSQLHYYLSYRHSLLLGEDHEGAAIPPKKQFGSSSDFITINVDPWMY